MSHRLPSQSWLNGKWKRGEARHRTLRKLGRPASSSNKQVPGKGGGRGFCFCFFSCSESDVFLVRSSSVDPAPTANSVVEGSSWRSMVALAKEDFTPLSWQLDGEGGENPATENGLFLRVRVSGGAGWLGAHGPGGEPLPGSVPVGKVRYLTGVGWGSWGQDGPSRSSNRPRLASLCDGFFLLSPFLCSFVEYCLLSRGTPPV